MTHDVLMPHLSDEVEEGVLANWFVEPGSLVAEGDLIAEVQVEKADVDVESPVAGRVLELRVPVGATVAQGAVIALIGEATEATEAPTVPAAARPVIAAPTTGAAGAAATQAAPASPAARRLARELGVDLAGVKGSGPNGRIVEDDVRAAASGSPAAGIAPIGEAMTPKRQVLASRLRSWLGSTAQLTLTAEADVTDLADALAGVDGGASFLEAVVRASALALRDHPRLGARLIDDRIVLPSAIDVGVAVATDDGLLVPVVRGADDKDLDALHAEIDDLARRARAGQLKNPDMEGAVFTVTSLGGYRIDAFTPLLDPPQTAILGVGRARPRPAVVDDRVVPRLLMTLSLTIDHQVNDGAPGAKYLTAVLDVLEHPRPRLAGTL